VAGPLRDYQSIGLAALPPWVKYVKSRGIVNIPLGVLVLAGRGKPFVGKAYGCIHRGSCSKGYRESLSHGYPGGHIIGLGVVRLKYACKSGPL